MQLRGLVVHGDSGGGQSQVEIEPGEVLGGPGGDRGVALDPTGGWVVVNLDVIRGHVVAAVARERKVWIADALGPDCRRRRRWGGCRG